jgi:hypothetical protein
MKKLIIILLLVIPTYLYAGTAKKIDVYSQGTYLQSYTIEEFTALVNNSEILLGLTEAEKSSQVFILLSDSEYTFVDDTYKGFVTIVWKEKDVVLKEIRIKLTLTLTKTDPTLLQQMRDAYTKIAVVSFPAVLIILLIIIL